MYYVYRDNQHNALLLCTNRTCTCITVTALTSFLFLTVAIHVTAEKQLILYQTQAQVRQVGNL